MPNQYKFQWEGPRSLDSRLRELFTVGQPSEQFLRIVDTYGEMAASNGFTFGFTQPIDVMALCVPGLVLDEVRNNTSFEPFRACFKERLASALAADQQQLHPPFDVMAEASAASLLQRLGWMVEKLQEGLSRMPDLMATRNACELEVEVVASQRKDDEKRRQDSIQRRIEEVPRRADATIVVAVVDELSDQETDNIAAAVEILQIGEIAEVRDRWMVSIIPPDQQDAAAPDWWPKQYVQPFATSVHLGPVTKRVTFKWGLSYSAYRNSPLRKIDRSQFTGTRPSLIAWDRAELYGALKWARENGLELIGEHNGHISGLLAFGLDMSFSGEVKWNYVLIQNPHARIPLPDDLMGLGEGEVTVRLYGAAL
jgi:hypothetical protein